MAKVWINLFSSSFKKKDYVNWLKNVIVLLSGPSHFGFEMCWEHSWWWWPGGVFVVHMYSFVLLYCPFTRKNISMKYSAQKGIITNIHGPLEATRMLREAPIWRIDKCEGTLPTLLILAIYINTNLTFMWPKHNKTSPNITIVLLICAPHFPFFLFTRALYI